MFQAVVLVRFRCHIAVLAEEIFEYWTKPIIIIIIKEIYFKL
jgi:hypothetical protein